MVNAQYKLENEKNVPSAGPRGAGAITATTGGHPEDMNEMPPTYLEDENPIYDGSQLARGESVEKIPTEEKDQTLEP